jgi:SAM-dependent methyltransferase
MTSIILHRHGDKIKKEYEAHMAKHDPNSPEAAHWTGRDKTWLRLRILSEIDTLDGKKVLDFGCGNALLLDFLNEKNIRCEYYGWDISEKMIAIAKERHPDAKFDVKDVLADDLGQVAGFFDYVLISGVFYIKKNSSREIHRKWTEGILRRLWPLCSGGLAVNFLSDFVDWMDKDLYYCPVSEIMRFCRQNFTRWVVLRHDYELWEYTLYLYREPRVRL